MNPRMFVYRSCSCPYVYEKVFIIFTDKVNRQHGGNT